MCRQTGSNYDIQSTHRQNKLDILVNGYGQQMKKSENCAYMHPAENKTLLFRNALSCSVVAVELSHHTESLKQLLASSLLTKAKLPFFRKIPLLSLRGLYDTCQNTATWAEDTHTCAVLTQKHDGRHTLHSGGFFHACGIKILHHALGQYSGLIGIVFCQSGHQIV